MNPEEFFEWLKASALEACQKYNLPVSCLLAQGAIESGWGQYTIGQFNLFGRKWGGWGNYIELPTNEWDGSQYVDIVAKFQDYDSLEQACEDWCELMLWGPYEQFGRQYQSDHDLETFVRGIAAVYATGPDYGDNIMSTIRANELEQYDI